MDIPIFALQKLQNMGIPANFHTAQSQYRKFAQTFDPVFVHFAMHFCLLFLVIKYPTICNHNETIK